MSQVRKLQQGGAAPASATPKLKFKINGSDYDTDEQFVRDQFNPIFDSMLKAGKAKEKDREGWQGVYEQYINQARQGGYSFHTSGDKFYNGEYQGQPGNGANLGKDQDGQTARKGFFGHLLGGDRETDANQRMASLNPYVGDAIVKSFESKTAADKAKSDADAAKVKGDALNDVLGKVTKLNQGFGEYHFGKNFTEDPNLIGQKWWDPKLNDDQQRKSAFADYNTSKIKQLFDSSLDPYAADIKAKSGMDIGALRAKAKELGIYNPTTGAINAEDISKNQTLWGTMHSDEPFLNRSTDPKVAAANVAATAQAKADADLKAKLPTASGKLWSKDGITYLDKDGKNLADGYHDGKVYEKGKLWNGAYVYNNDYNSPLTGYLLNGVKTDRNAYVKYYNDTQANPENAPILKNLDDKMANVQKTFGTYYGDINNYQHKFSDMTAGRNPFHSYKGNLGGAMNFTPRFEGFNNGKIIQYYDKNKLDQFGNYAIRNKIRLDNNKEFDGKLAFDRATQTYKLLKDDGTAETDSDLTNALRTVKYNPTASANDDIYYTPSSTPNTAATSTQSAIAGGLSYPSVMKNGGVIEKFQLGGAVDPSNPEGKTKQTSIKDAAYAFGHNDYKLSTLDKWELGALGTDLGGVLASLTGAGSVVAGGLGLAGTAAQFGTDVARDGLDWGDVGRAGIGLGLDAASFIPGLGVFAKEGKTLKTLSRVSKVIIPALTAAGFVRGASVVGDLVSGKKKFTDLSVDDLRDLTGGIHSVIGGSRMLTQKLGTTTGDVLKLKDGTPINLSATDANALENTHGDEKITLARDIAARVTGKNPDDIQFPTGRKLNMTWKPNEMISKVEKPEVSNGAPILRDISEYQGDGLMDGLMRRSIKLSATRNPSLAKGLLKDGAEGFEYDPETKNISVNQPTLSGNRMGVFGDYVRPGVSIQPGKGGSLGDAVGDAKRISKDNWLNTDAENFSTPNLPNTPETNTTAYNDRYMANKAFGSKDMNASKEVSYQETRNRVAGLKGTNSSTSAMNSLMSTDFKEGTLGDLLKKQIGDALSTPNAKGWVKFKAGGRIVKAQDGSVMRLLTNLPDLTKTASSFNTYFGANKAFPFRVPSDTTSDADRAGLTPAGGAGYLSILGGAPAQLTAPTPSTILPSTLDRPITNVPAVTGSDTWSSQGGTLGQNRNPAITTGSTPVTNNYRDYTPLSELGRALYTRQLNSQIDTRVERPMISAPLETPISVTGNLLAKASADKQANDLIRNSSIPRSSDGALNSIIALQANSNAAQVRTQGDMANADAINRTRQAATQAAMQASQQRTEVANQNIHTLANATQAERQALNEKHAMMNQPIVDYWKDQNFQARDKNQQNKMLDTQIAGLGEQTKVSGVINDLQNKMNAIDMQITNKTTPEQMADLQRQRSTLNQQYNYTINRSQQAGLMMRKDPNFRTTPDYYIMPDQTAPTTNPTLQPTSYKDGGRLRVDIENSKADYRHNKDVSEAENTMNNTSIKENSKRDDLAAKQIQDLIKMALK